ncbi:thioredoxin [Nakamurella deserti]|uniref:thioredoxin n=1 Tax=Nakamurella deserti TaxID=2164074 RepID=UPI000DBEA408|nr:thioredoxin [Nakamurella deserti]
MAALPSLTAAAFDDHIAGDDPVLVDFWAPWCGSCRLLTPTVERLAGELAGRARVVTVDVDAAPELAARRHVMSVPTLVLYRAGAEVTRIAGVKSRATLLATLEAHL